MNDPGCREALDRLDRAGMAVAIWDMTTDNGIPAFRCLIAEGDQHPARLRRGSVGMGCHPDRAIALLRALTEAAQARLAIISAGRDEPITWTATRTRTRTGQSSRRTSPPRRPATSRRFPRS